MRLQKLLVLGPFPTCKCSFSAIINTFKNNNPTNFDPASYLTKNKRNEDNLKPNTYIHSNIYINLADYSTQVTYTLPLIDMIDSIRLEQKYPKIKIKEFNGVFLKHTKTNTLKNIKKTPCPKLGSRFKI
jgi:hypothetical protein